MHILIVHIFEQVSFFGYTTTTKENKKVAHETGFHALRQQTDTSVSFRLCGIPLLFLIQFFLLQSKVSDCVVVFVEDSHRNNG